MKLSSINYLGCLTNRVKFHICNPPGVVKWGLTQKFSTDFLVQAYTSHDAPNRRAYWLPCMQGSAFEGLVDT